MTLFELAETAALLVTVALTFLIREPLAVVFTEVVDEPFIKAEPCGTLLAEALVVEVTLQTADASVIISPLQDVDDVAVPVAGITA